MLSRLMDQRINSLILYLFRFVTQVLINKLLSTKGLVRRYSEINRSAKKRQRTEETTDKKNPGLPRRCTGLRRAARGRRWQ